LLVSNADLPGRRTLRSAGVSRLPMVAIRQAFNSRQSTAGFLTVAGTPYANVNVKDDLLSPSVRRKTSLFKSSYPGAII